MVVFEPHVPLGSGELHEEHVGLTTVLVDPRLGPVEFRRDGELVPCVCDPERGVQCAYHAGERIGRCTVVFGGQAT